jgi:hypothetical protein
MKETIVFLFWPECTGFINSWQFSKWTFEFTGPNQILEFILYNIYLNKNWKFNCLNKVLLVLGRTGAHREDCPGIPFLLINYIIDVVKVQGSKV